MNRLINLLLLSYIIRFDNPDVYERELNEIFSQNSS